MKKFFALLLTLACVLSLAACGSEAAPTETPDNQTNEDPADTAFTTVEEGKLHMATNAAFPPYEMTTDAGGFEGIDVDVAAAIAEKLGLELVVDDMDFNSVITAVQQGSSDIAMAGLTVNEERKQNVDFTASYATGVQVVIVKAGSDITLDNLGDQMIGTQESTTGYIYCADEFGEDHVIAYTNGATAVQSLLAGSVDCVVIDNEPAKAFVAANPDLTILDTEYAVEDYAIGVSKENSALLEAVDTALQDLIADGTVQSIVDKYITAE
ncbi:polar amino acid transport system substrate-binding protein [Oscillibacter sp. PC13]|uniref:ABC transporter substrate-binding protein n=1 Tax=Oscillibacter sp. PC13 TaxID=1855299 RepID=UPI0008F0791D|nr:ABC transporter substrate-binding protein [Oscillibacter sp. PC13]SFP66451.1 polar amino acid transport system substrate-binding protein [Oscillibacter sp. PC13]